MVGKEGGRGGARAECSLSQGESPPSWPFMTTSPGLKRTCPSRKESACRSSITRECPCPAAEPTWVSCHLRPSRRAPSPAAAGMGAPRGTRGLVRGRQCGRRSFACSLTLPALLPVTIALQPCHQATSAAGQSVPSSTGPHPCRSPVPSSAQLPLVCLGSSAPLHGCFPLCLHGVSDLSFSPDSFFSPLCHAVV